VVIARFDDLRPHRRRSFMLVDFEKVMEARTAEEVAAVMAEAEAAVRDGKWVAGFVSYEAAPQYDPAMRVKETRGTPTADLPLAWFGVARRRGPAPPTQSLGYVLEGWRSHITVSQHAAAVTEIRRRIRDGDTYQVNFTFRLDARFEGSAEGLYGDLVNSQACGYGALIDTGRFVVVSASPELFFEWRHRRIVCRPMKGTRRRGLLHVDDEQQRTQLEASEKDRAENLMIVDMVRNDLGRIARVGTVRVPALFRTEKYDTVWQLTSTVEAEPDPGTGLHQVFGALFPSASITGAPKVATMAIIEELEDDPRGVYCGAIGFGGPDSGGEAQWAFNVAIRTVLIDRRQARALYGTGGGITFDSTAAGEYEEALLKAAVLSRSSASFDLIETMRWTPGEGFWLLARHLDRLSASAGYFDIPLDPAEARAALRAAVAGKSVPLRVRLSLSRSGKVAVAVSDLEPSAQIGAVVDSQSTDPSDVFHYHKTTNRRMYDDALVRAGAVDDVIMVDPDGHVTETTIGNLAAEIAGVWWTPPVACGLLPGTYRAELIASGRLKERPIGVAELSGARLARINAVRGWEELKLV
jgi:para-aminobenzoate synthetase/4-amino-4-deoxychorismate lyase